MYIWKSSEPGRGMTNDRGEQVDAQHRTPHTFFGRF
jgi:hypothetical protein